MKNVELFLERLNAAKLALQESTASFSITSPPSLEEQQKTIEVGRAYEELKVEGHSLLVQILTRTNKDQAAALGVSDNFLRAVRSGKKKISGKLMTEIKNEHEAIGRLIESIQ